MEKKRFMPKSTAVVAVQVNTRDHDEMCEIIEWSGGRAIGEQDGHPKRFVIEVNGVPAADGDYVVQQDGRFEIYDGRKFHENFVFLGYA